MKWDDIRDEVDKAIRAGLTKDDFCSDYDIDRTTWYKIKPKGFKWRQIQHEKGIKIKLSKPRKRPTPKLKVVDQPKVIDTFTPTKLHCSRYGCDTLHDDLGLCYKCKSELLECVMIIYRSGFTDIEIRGVLG